MPDCFLGLDLGTSSLKALLVDDAGRVLGRGAAGYSVRYPRSDHAEQDPDEWWWAAVTAARQALAGTDGTVTVVAIGLSGQMHGTVLLGDRDDLLAPAVIWADQRSWREVAEITARIGAERLIELCGSPVATGFQAATLRWFQREQSELWRRVRTVLAPKDDLRRRLTGVITTEPSDGSGTLLLDVRRRDWSPEVLAALDIPPELLPPVHPSTAVVGQLRPDAAASLGLPPGIPVVAGAGDAPSGALGAGVVEPETMLVSLSTGAQVLVPSTEVRVDGRGRLHTFCGALPPGPARAGWYQMGATLVAGLAMRWLRDRVLDVGGEDADEQMTAWAAEAPVGAGGLLFLPYLVGERTPHMDPRARGAFLGLAARHGRPELVRAVMEGVALACRDAFAVLAEVGATPSSIVLAGGGARSALWQQIMADIFNLPVRPLATAEQSALGAALLAGTGVGRLDPIAASRAWARYDDPVQPNPERHARYADLVALFREAWTSLSAISHRLSAFSDGDQPSPGG